MVNQQKTLAAIPVKISVLPKIPISSTKNTSYPVNVAVNINKPQN